jgi:hypothetical protein
MTKTTTATMTAAKPTSIPPQEVLHNRPLLGRLSTSLRRLPCRTGESLRRVIAATGIGLRHRCRQRLARTQARGGAATAKVTAVNHPTSHTGAITTSFEAGVYRLRRRRRRGHLRHHPIRLRADRHHHRLVLISVLATRRRGSATESVLPTRHRPTIKEYQQLESDRRRRRREQRTGVPPVLRVQRAGTEKTVIGTTTVNVTVTATALGARIGKARKRVWWTTIPTANDHARLRSTWNAAEEKTMTTTVVAAVRGIWTRRCEDQPEERGLEHLVPPPAASLPPRKPLPIAPLCGAAGITPKTRSAATTRYHVLLRPRTAAAALLATTTPHRRTGRTGQGRHRATVLTMSTTRIIRRGDLDRRRDRPGFRSTATSRSSVSSAAAHPVPTVPVEVEGHHPRFHRLHLEDRIRWPLS